MYRLKYIKPEISICNIQTTQIIASSNEVGGFCDDWCKLWHICQDRQRDKKCKDKEYRY